MHLRMYIWIGSEFSDMQFDRQFRTMKQVLDDNATVGSSLDKLGYGDANAISWMGSDREICGEIFDIMYNKMDKEAGFINARQAVIDVAQALGLSVTFPVPDDILLTCETTQNEFEARLNIVKLAQ